MGYALADNLLREVKIGIRGSLTTLNLQSFTTSFRIFEGITASEKCISHDTKISTLRIGEIIVNHFHHTIFFSIVCESMRRTFI